MSKHNSRVTPVPTQTLTPDEAYAQEIPAGLEELQAWFDGPITEWDIVLGQEASTGMSNGDSLFFCISAIESGFGCGDSSDKEWQADVLPAAQAIAEGGFAVKSMLGAVTPPATVRVAHEQIVACIDYKIEIANMVIGAITQEALPTSDATTDPCNLLETAIKQVRAFADNTE